MSAQPEFQMDDVDTEQTEDLFNGEEVMNKLLEMNQSGQFDCFTCSTADQSLEPHEYECFGYTLLNRYGINRIYLALRDTKDADDGWYTYYMARRDNGLYVIVQETDETMREDFRQTMLEISREEEAAASNSESAPKKKSGGKTALKVILIIICFPFWLLWQFIKALLSLFNIGFGDSSAVKAFKRGYDGDADDLREYTFTNDMGCRQTVYSRDGRSFYYSDGSYAGSSDDGGKTIH